MTTVHRLQLRAAGPTLDEAVAAFCNTLDSWGTRRVYAGTLRALVDRLGPTAAVGILDAPETAAALTAWFTDRWGGRAAATYNRNLDALRSALGYWREQDWLSSDPTRALRRRRRPVDRTRALARSEVEQLLAREDVPIREKTLWRMLYETAARAAEVLALDVEDLDLRNRRARVRRKGGAVDVIVWQTGTARLLPRLLNGRRSGPVFLTERRARLESGTNRGRSGHRLLSIGRVHEGGGASGRNTSARSSLSTRVRTWSRTRSRRWAGHRGGPALPRRALTAGVHLTHRAPPPTVCPALV